MLLRAVLAVVYGAVVMLSPVSWSGPAGLQGRRRGMLLLAHAKDSPSVEDSLGLQCPPCEKIHCTPRRPRRLKCKGGTTRGICNCCPVCAKTEGESCGGAWQYLGKCDRGLHCQARPEQQVPKGKTAEGTCQKVPGGLLDEGLPAYCQPKCTAEYCRLNPKAICAAVDISDRKQDCQGDCQHTSCSACRFVRDEPDCVKCRKDDFSCMRRFAKCVKQTYCSRQKYPCKRHGVEEKGAKFRCLVPECLIP